MYVLSQKSGPALLLKLIPLLMSLEKTVASWTNPDVLKELYDNVPRESTVSHIYFKRYLELVVPEALARARACTNLEELENLIVHAVAKGLEEEAYCFVKQFEVVEQKIFKRAKICSSENEAQFLLSQAYKDTVEEVIYELRWMEFHLQL
jgi:hypothetical protein